MVNEMLEARVIQESRSPWVSPVVLVRKDGSLHFCVDYRRLKKEKMFIPCPALTIYWINWMARECSSPLMLVHARTGYWQIRMHEASREKTAFAVMNGLYEFCVMLFGLCNSPATLQWLIQKTLAGLGDDVPF